MSTKNLHGLGFQAFNMCFLFILNNNLKQCVGLESTTHNLKNGTKVIYYQDFQECKSNEFYDFDYFLCLSCNRYDKHLQPSPDKQSCQCPANLTVLYESIKKQQKCIRICETSYPDEIERDDNEDCLKTIKNTTDVDCKFLYVNFTQHQQRNEITPPSSQSIAITAFNPSGITENCTTCNLKYNYRFKNYCIVNELIKPYLHYNTYWLATTKVNHFVDLKYVAFFCLALRNTTSCNHLANLCVLSHFSFDKNSPCSSFLLTQASDVVLKYGTFDEQNHSNFPLLFYKKGKPVTEMLQKPIQDFHFTTSSQSKRSTLNLYSKIYNLNGSLKKWDEFKLSDVNLCNMHMSGPSFTEKEIKIGSRNINRHCQMTLESIINLASIYGNDYFMNIYFNIFNPENNKTISMQQLPILIEDIYAENKGQHTEEWQLVKRFIVIEAQTKFNYGQSLTAKFKNSKKLLMYRSIRYIEHFEINYKIHDENRISLPLIKLRYNQIELNANSSLDSIHDFKLEVTFERLNEGSRRQLIFDVILPIMLFISSALAFLRALNIRRRRASIEFCELPCIKEFVLNLSSYIANALILCFLLYVVWLVTEFTTQTTVKLTLPLLKDKDDAIKWMIYCAFVIKLIYLCLHAWRLSNFDLFFIDWERPKSSDNNHFNLKSNMETSSVSSSVRTFVGESNGSAWRVFFIANEWLRLCVKQRTSATLQAFLVYVSSEVFAQRKTYHNDLILDLFTMITLYLFVYLVQFICREYIWNRISGSPLQKFVDLCSLANISVLAFVDASYGYYIHGRSPHGFADTDMTSMIIQLQRESQSMCARRGLLSDSDQQTYIVLPPKNLRNYIERLLIPFQRSCSQAQLLKGVSTVENILERTSMAYSSINKFFCAFIDHAIKDMDYIIKEKTLSEHLLDCEFDSYFTENKGTFYIDKSYSFSKMFLYGNQWDIFLTQLSLFLSMFAITSSTAMGVIAVCIFDMLFKYLFKHGVRYNLTQKTLIDKMFFF